MIRLLILPLAMVMMLSGCNYLGFLGYVIAPNIKKKVPAECDKLPTSKVAIVVYADMVTLAEYPQVRLDLPAVIAQELKKNVKDVKVVDVRRVARYQDENLNWENMHRSELAKVFQADYVLYVALMTYATHEEGSLTLLRGQIASQVGLYKAAASGEREDRVYATEISVQYPKDTFQPRMGEDDSGIRLATDQEFAKALARKFYQYEADDDDNP